MRNFGRRYESVAYLAVGAVIAAILLTIAWPGFMSYDSLRALRGAREGVQDSLWPPMVSYIWWVVERLYPGPAGMLFFQNMLLASSTVWFLRSCGATLRWSVVATFITFGLPPVLGPSLVVWKDIEMAAFLMLAYASYSEYLTRGQGKGLLYVCVISLAIACLVRHNAFFAALPLIMQWSLTRGWPIWKGVVVGIIGVLIICFLPGSFVNSYRLPDLKPISVRQTDVIKSLAVHDAIGASICAQHNFFQGMMSDPFDVHFLEENYSARHFNENGKILGRIDMKAFDPGLTYRSIIHQAPRCLFAHKIAMGQFILGVNEGPVYYITHGGIDENELGYALEPSEWRDLIIRALLAAAHTPIAAPFTYFLICLALLIPAARKLDLRGLHPGVSLILASGMTMAFTNFFILPAADLRYSFWPVTTWIVGSLYLAQQFAFRRSS